MTRIAALAAAALLAAGCSRPLFGVNLFVVGEKTALETQVLGTYKELGRDLASYASVRGVEPDGSLKRPPEKTPSQQEVLRAFDNRRYNRDDVDALLAAGIVGEANDGTLAPIPGAPAGTSALTPEAAARVIAEENADRATIIDRLVATTPGVKPEDRADVAWVFAQLNRDLAPAGARIQSRTGEWSAK